MAEDQQEQLRQEGPAQEAPAQEAPQAVTLASLAPKPLVVTKAEMRDHEAFKKARAYQAQGAEVVVADDDAEYERLTGKKPPGAAPAGPTLTGSGLWRTDAEGQEWVVTTKSALRNHQYFKTLMSEMGKRNVPFERLLVEED